MNYPIQNDAGYFWTGRTATNGQVIFGLLAPDIVLFHFDEAGNYVKKEAVPLSTPPERDDKTGIYRLDSQFMARFSGELRNLMKRIGYTPTSVSIQAFFDPASYVGILPFPSKYQAFLDCPERLSAAQREEYSAYVTEWEHEGNFVFCWAEEYWMNSEGEIEAT